MKVAVVDQGFIRAPVERVYELVGDPATYPRWWPRVRSSGNAVDLPVLGSVSVRTEVVKPGVEVNVRIEGRRARGHLLWYLEPFRDGTIAYVVTNVETARRWSPRRVLRSRASMRRALLELKTLLED